jgi:hypothetical protein
MWVNRQKNTYTYHTFTATRLRLCLKNWSFQGFQIDDFDPGPEFSPKTSLQLRRPLVWRSCRLDGNTKRSKQRQSDIHTWSARKGYWYLFDCTLLLSNPTLSYLDRMVLARIDDGAGKDGGWCWQDISWDGFVIRAKYDLVSLHISGVT